jgi:Flp pilus assembly pilin Flp
MSTFMQTVRRLNRDESGMETMQAVIIFGVAAAVLAIMYRMKDAIIDWVKEQLTALGII